VDPDPAQVQGGRFLNRLRARSGPVLPVVLPAFLPVVLLAAFLISLPPCRALAQEAPPLEADGPPQTSAHAPAPVRPRATRPVPFAPAKSAPAKPVPARPASATPSPGVAKALSASAKSAPVKPTARGPAVKNDGKRYLRSLDENHDGRISHEEFLAGGKKRFAKLDLNHDGVISAQEAKAAQAKMRERKAASDAKRLAQGKPVKGKAKSDRPARPYLSGFDANKDGRVTRKEYLAKREKAFAEMDLNHDGVISKDEAKAAKAKKLARREERKAETRERKARKKARTEASAAAPAPEADAVNPSPASPAL